MSLLERYPLTHRNGTSHLRKLLEWGSTKDDRLREDLARAINDIADKACDLEDIYGQLLAGPRDRDALADLLVAFELTVEQIRGHSDAIDGKLYELADSLRPAPETQETSS